MHSSSARLRENPSQERSLHVLDESSWIESRRSATPVLCRRILTDVDPAMSAIAAAFSGAGGIPALRALSGVLPADALAALPTLPALATSERHTAPLVALLSLASSSSSADSHDALLRASEHLCTIAASEELLLVRSKCAFYCVLQTVSARNAPKAVTACSRSSALGYLPRISCAIPGCSV